MSLLLLWELRPAVWILATSYHWGKSRTGDTPVGECCPLQKALKSIKCFTDEIQKCDKHLRNMYDI